MQKVIKHHELLRNIFGVELLEDVFSNFKDYTDIKKDNKEYLNKCAQDYLKNEDQTINNETKNKE